MSTIRRTVRLAALVILASLIGNTAALAALPAGFTETNINRPDGQAWEEAVGMQFVSTGGRLFVWERGGDVWIVDPAHPSTTRFLDIRNEVAAYNDHGMLGFVLHPGFESNGFVYVIYTVERHHLENCDSPRDGAPVCGPNYVPGTHQPFQATIGRIVRYKAVLPAGQTSYALATAIDPASRKVLLGESFWFTDPNRLDPTKPRNTGCAILFDSHGVGSLVFGEDGTLLATCGDGASYNGADVGPGSDSYHAQAVQDGIIRSQEDVGAYRSQMINSFNGKVLRLDPNTGDGIPSNPFYDAANPRAAKSRVWALGMRNPFRFTVRPGTGSHDPALGNPGVLMVGDVGWVTYEDLNVVRVGGQNFGWPSFEGQLVRPEYNNQAIDNRDAPNPLYNGTSCTRQFFRFNELIKQDTLATPSWPNPCNASQQITSADVFLHSRPALDWQHDVDASRFAAFSGTTAVAQPIGTTAPDGTTVLGSAFNGNTSTGGVWYQGDDFPAQYKNTYFHGDYGAQWIRNFVFDQNNVLKEVRTFGTGLGGVVAIVTDPQSGALYYIAWTAFIRKISFAPTTNVPPVAVATTDKSFGPSPLTVQLSAAGSSDGNGGTLTYSWDFGDGSSPQSGLTVSHTYTAAGVQSFAPTVTVRDPTNLTSTASVLVSVNNTPPTATITSPQDGTRYPLTGSTQYTLSATLDDAESGSGALACSWTRILHHNTHTHNDPPDNHCQSTGTTTPLGCGDETYYFEFRLTATDPQGLTVTRSTFVYPDCGAADTTPPSAPTGLTATAQSDTQIDLSWNAATDNLGVTNYLIERCQGAGCSDFTQFTTTLGTTYSNPGLTANTSYSYRVRAMDAAANRGGYSNIATTTTPNSPPPPTTVIRVNVGGPAYTDSLAQVWSADTGFNTGTQLSWPPSTAIAGTNDPALYRDERWDPPAAPDMTYSFNVPNGTYTVRLHFAENYDALFAVGQRVFDVNINGVLAFDNIDVYAEVGARTALIKTATATVTNGNLSIAFIHQVEDPMVYAIEIISQAITPDTTPPSAPGTLTATATSGTQINLGWGAATDNVGVTEYLIESCQGAGCSNFTQIATASGTTFSNTGLTASTPYSYRVRARDAAGNNGAYSNTSSATTQTPAPDTTPPSLPGTLTATAAGQTQINLSWGAATDNVGVTGYLIESCQGTGCSNFAQIASTTGTGTTFNNTGLTVGTPYSYRVRARDAADNRGGYSNTASATTQSTPATVIRVNVGGSAYTDSASNVWSADTGFNTGNAKSVPATTAIAGTSDPALYRDQRWDGPAAPEMTYSFNVPNGTYTVRLHFSEKNTSLFAVGQRVFDVNIQGALAFDNIDVFAQVGARTALIKTATATVSNGILSITFIHQVEDPFVDAIEVISQSVAPDTTPPSAPGTLTATAAGQTQINLSWGAATDNVGVTGYLIESCQGAGCSNFAQIGTTTGATTFSNTGLTANTPYSYRVRARDAAGNNGGYSNTASATTQSASDTTPPSAPGTLTATAAGATQINLSWGAATDNVAVTGYLIERCQGAGCSNFAQIAAPTGTGTTFSNTGLTANTPYSYRIRARDAAGNNGGYSNTASATTQNTPATAIRVNVGGPAYTDSGSNVWSADTGFNTGTALSWPANTAIAGTSDPALYRNERWDAPSAPVMTYTFNVPNGTYTVRLHFAENYSPLFAVGQRVFDVNIQGVLAFDNLDVFAQAGARTALIKTATATVTNGTLSIAFVHQVEDPFVDAIEILSQ